VYRVDDNRDLHSFRRELEAEFRDRHGEPFDNEVGRGCVCRSGFVAIEDESLFVPGPAPQQMLRDVNRRATGAHSRALTIARNGRRAGGVARRGHNSIPQSRESLLPSARALRDEAARLCLRSEVHGCR
jgi:hypothetical protein